MLFINNVPLVGNLNTANLKLTDATLTEEGGPAEAKTVGEKLEELKASHACVGDVRYIGLFSAIELVKDKTTKECFLVSTTTLNKDGNYIFENYKSAWRTSR